MKMCSVPPSTNVDITADLSASPITSVTTVCTGMTNSTTTSVTPVTAVTSDTTVTSVTSDTTVTAVTPVTPVTPVTTVTTVTPATPVTPGKMESGLINPFHKPLYQPYPRRLTTLVGAGRYMRSVPLPQPKQYFVPAPIPAIPWKPTPLIKIATHEALTPVRREDSYSPQVYRTMPLLNDVCPATQDPNTTIHVASILKAPTNQLIVHSIGCDNSLGAGIAKTLDATYDIKRLLPKGRIGRAYITNSGRPIANLYTKEKSYLLYDTRASFYSALRNLKDIISSDTHFAIPKLECGLNQQKWEHIWKIFRNVFPENKVDIYLLKEDRDLYCKPKNVDPNTNKIISGSVLNTPHFDPPVKYQVIRKSNDWETPRRVMRHPPQMRSFVPTGPSATRSKSPSERKELPFFLSKPSFKSKTHIIAQHSCNKTCQHKHHYRYREENLPMRKKLLLRQLRTAERTHDMRFILEAPKNFIQKAVQQSNTTTPIKDVITQTLENWVVQAFNLDIYDLVNGAASLGVIVSSLITLFTTKERLTKATSIFSIVAALVGLVTQVLKKRANMKITKEQVRIITDTIQKAIVAENEQQPLVTRATSCPALRVDKTVVVDGTTLLTADPVEQPPIDLTAPEPANLKASDIMSIVLTGSRNKEPEKFMPITDPDFVLENRILNTSINVCCKFQTLTELIDGILNDKYLLIDVNNAVRCAQCSSSIAFRRCLTLDQSSELNYIVGFDMPPEKKDFFLAWISEECPHFEHFSDLVSMQEESRLEFDITKSTQAQPDGTLKQAFSLPLCVACVCEQSIPIDVPDDVNALTIIETALTEYRKSKKREHDKSLKGYYAYQCEILTWIRDNCFPTTMEQLRKKKKDKKSTATTTQQKGTTTVTTTIPDESVDMDSVCMGECFFRETPTSDLPHAVQEFNIRSAWASKAISYVVMAMGALILAGASHFTPWFKDLSHALSFFKSISTLNQSDMFHSIEEFVATEILEISDPKTATRKAIMDKIEELEKFVATPFATMIDNYSFPTDFSKCITSARTMFKDYSHMKDFQSACVALNRKTEIADRRLADVRAAWAQMGTRQTPAAWMVYGEAGIGKTHANLHIGEEISKTKFPGQKPYVIDATNEFYSTYVGQGVTIVQEVCNEKDLTHNKLAKSLNTAISNGVWNLEGAFIKDMPNRSLYWGGDTNKDPKAFLDSLPTAPEAAYGTISRFTWFKAVWNTKYTRGQQRYAMGHRDDYDHLRYIPVRLDSKRHSVEEYSLNFDGKSYTELTVKEVIAFLYHLEKIEQNNFKKLHSNNPLLEQLDVLSKANLATMQSSTYVRSICLQGEPGEGKTRLIRLLLKRLAEEYPIPVISIEPGDNALQACKDTVIPDNPVILVLDDVLTESTHSLYGEELEATIMSLYNRLKPSSIMITSTNLRRVAVAYTYPEVALNKVYSYNVPTLKFSVVYDKIFTTRGLYRRIGMDGIFLDRPVQPSWLPVKPVHSSRYTVSHNTSFFTVLSEKATDPMGNVYNTDECVRLLTSKIIADYKNITKPVIHYDQTLPTNFSPAVKLGFESWKQFRDFFSQDMNVTTLMAHPNKHFTLEALEACSKIRFSDIRYNLPEEATPETCTDVLLYFIRVMHRYSIYLPVLIEVEGVGQAWYDGHEYYLSYKDSTPCTEDKLFCAYDPATSEVLACTMKGIKHRIPLSLYYGLFEATNPPLDEYMAIPPDIRQLYQSYKHHPLKMVDELQKLRKIETTQAWKTQLIAYTSKAKTFVSKYKWYFIGMAALVTSLTLAIPLLTKSPEFDAQKIRMYYLLKYGQHGVDDDLEDYMKSLDDKTRMANRDKILSIEEEVRLVLNKRPPTVAVQEPEPDPVVCDSERSTFFDAISNFASFLREKPKANLDELVEKVVQPNETSERKSRSRTRTYEAKKRKFTPQKKLPDDNIATWDDLVTGPIDTIAGNDDFIDWNDAFNEKNRRIAAETLKDADFNVGPKFTPEKRYALIKRNVCKIETERGVCFALGFYGPYLITVGHMASDGKNICKKAVITLDESESTVEANLLTFDLRKDLSLWKATRPIFKDCQKWFITSEEDLPEQLAPITLYRQDGNSMNYITGTIVTLQRRADYIVQGEQIQTYQNLVLQSFLNITQELVTTNGDCGQVYGLNTAREGQPFIYGIHCLALRDIKNTGASLVTRNLINTLILKHDPQPQDAKIIEVPLKPATVEQPVAEERGCVMCKDKVNGNKLQLDKLPAHLVCFTPIPEKVHYKDIPQVTIYDPKNHDNLQKFLDDVITSKNLSFCTYINYGPNSDGSVPHPHLHLYQKIKNKMPQIARFMHSLGFDTLTPSKVVISPKETFFLKTVEELREMLRPFKNDLQLYTLPYAGKVFGVAFKSGQCLNHMFASRDVKYTQCPVNTADAPCLLTEEPPTDRSLVKIISCDVPTLDKDGNVVKEHKHYVVEKRYTSFEKSPKLTKKSRVSVEKCIAENVYIATEGRLHILTVNTQTDDGNYIHLANTMLVDAAVNLHSNQNFPIYRSKTENCITLGTRRPVILPVRHQYTSTPFGALANACGFQNRKQNAKLLDELTHDETWLLTPDSLGNPNQIVHQLAMTDIEKPNIPEPIIDLIVSEYASEFAVKYGRFCTFATEGEVLNGHLSKYCPRVLTSFSPLETDSSAGITLALLYKVTKKDEIIGTHPTGIRYWQDNQPSRELQKAYKRSKDMLLNNKRPPLAFQTCFKEELLPCSKAWKGRVFEADDMLGVLLERWTFGRLVGALSKFEITEECAVGIDPNVHFEEIATLHSALPYHFAGDFSRWDKRVSLDLARILIKVQARAHEITFHAYQPCTCGWVNANNTLMMSIFSSVRFVFNTFYRVTGMPSGTYLTATHNSKLVDILLYLAFYKLTGMTSIADYRKNVIISTYGDDTLVSISAAIKDKFNLETLVPAVFEISGAVLDSDTKDGNIVPYRHNLSELSFISRTPILQPTGIYAGALKKITIEAWLYWYRKQPTDIMANQVMSNNLSSALWEASAWGEEYFHQVVQVISLILKTYPQFLKTVRIFSYQDYQAIRFNVTKGLRLGSPVLAKLKNDILNAREIQEDKMCPEFDLLKSMCAQMDCKLIVHTLRKGKLLCNIVHSDENVVETYISDSVATENEAYCSLAKKAIFGLQTTGHYARLLAQTCLKIQKDLALKVMREASINKIYVYDEKDYFKDATTSMCGNIRYLEKDGEFALLSGAAQQAIGGDERANTYCQILRDRLKTDDIGVYLQTEPDVSLMQASQEMMPAAPPVLPEQEIQTIPKLDNVVPLPNMVTANELAAGAVKVYDEPQRQWLPPSFHWDAYTSFLNGTYELDTFNITASTTNGVLKTYSSGTFPQKVVSQYIESHEYSRHGITFIIDVIAPTGTKGRLGYSVVPSSYTSSDFKTLKTLYPWTEMSVDGDSSSAVTLRNVPNKGFATGKQIIAEKLMLFLTEPITSTYNATKADLLVTVRISAKLTPDSEFSMPTKHISEIWAAPGDVEYNRNYIPNSIGPETLNESSTSIIVTDSLHTRKTAKIVRRKPVWAEFEPTSNQRFNPNESLLGIIPIVSDDPTDPTKYGHHIPLFWCGEFAAGFNENLNNSLTKNQDMEVGIMAALSDTYGNAVSVTLIENVDMQTDFDLSGNFPFNTVKQMTKVEFTADISKMRYYMGFGYSGKMIIAIPEEAIINTVPINKDERSFKAGKYFTWKKDNDDMLEENWTKTGTLKEIEKYTSKKVGLTHYFIGDLIEPQYEGDHLNFSFFKNLSGVPTAYLQNMPVPTPTKLFFPIGEICYAPVNSELDPEWVDPLPLQGFQVTSWMSPEVASGTYNSLVFGFANQSTLLSAGETAIPSDFHYRVLKRLEREHREMTMLDLIQGDIKIGTVLFVPASGLFINTLETMKILPNVQVGSIRLQAAGVKDLPLTNTERWQNYQSSALTKKYIRATQEASMAAAAGLGALGGLFQGMGNYAEQQRNFKNQMDMLNKKGEQSLANIKQQGENSQNVANINVRGNLSVNKQDNDMKLRNQKEMADKNLSGRMQLAGLTSAANLASGRAKTSQYQNGAGSTETPNIPDQGESDA
nr:hypothetical protein [Hypera postica associated virus 1]